MDSWVTLNQGINGMLMQIPLMGSLGTRNPSIYTSISLGNFFTAHFQNLPYSDWVKMVTPIFQYNFTKIPLPNSTNNSMDIEICRKQQNFTTDAENQLNL